MSLASYHCSTPGWVSFRFGFPAAMTFEDTRRRKFTELMANHIFGHVKAKKALAVVDEEGRPNEFGDDGAIARPRFDRFPIARALIAFDFGNQALIHVRPFFERPAHRSLRAGKDHEINW